MNNTPHEENRRASDMTNGDYVALVVMLLGMVCGCVAIAIDNLTLMLVGLIVALPATVVKVRLTRARSQAAEREEQITGRDRRVPNTVRSGTRAAVTP